MATFWTFLPLPKAVMLYFNRLATCPLFLMFYLHPCLYFAFFCSSFLATQRKIIRWFDYLITLPSAWPIKLPIPFPISVFGYFILGYLLLNVSKIIWWFSMVINRQQMFRDNYRKLMLLRVLLNALCPSWLIQLLNIASSFVFLFYGNVCQLKLARNY